MRREGKFKVLNKFYNCYRTHRSGLVSLKVTILGGWYISLPPLETMVAIDWVCCRFFICLYDLNTVCFLSSSSWDVLETQILVCLCSANNWRENLVNIWIQCFYQISYRENFEKIQSKVNLETLPGVKEFLISSIAKQKMIACEITYNI